MSVTTSGVESLISLIEELCGIYLDETKGYLIDARFGSLIAKHGCEHYGALAALAKRADQGGLRSEIVDAITTNETLFFRDNSPFEALRHKILPDLVDQAESGRRSKRLRIWSAACSTGQEPYSIAMTLRDVIPDIETWSIDILGTDVSAAAVTQAVAGVYSSLEVSRGVVQDVLLSNFVEEAGRWRVRDDIRRMVRFETRNLFDPIAETNTFDIVFCRNVAIYFKQADRDKLFERLTNSMTEDGYLFVGSAESLSHLGPRFAPQHHCNCNVYRPNVLAANPCR